MADIMTAYLNPLRASGGAQSVKEPSTSGAALSDAEVRERTSRDTIELSEEGRSVINLQRNKELAQNLPDATKDRAAFDAALKEALEDVERIGILFGEVLYALHGNPLNQTAQSATAKDSEAGNSQNFDAINSLAQVAHLAKQFRDGTVDKNSFVSNLSTALEEINTNNSLFADIMNARRSNS